MDPRRIPDSEKDSPRTQLLEALSKVRKEDAENEATLHHLKELIHRVKEAGGDLNYYSKWGETPASIACARDKPAILRLLLEEKAEYDFIPPLGLAESNLTYAISHSIPCMHILLNAGASPNLKGSWSGQTPLSCAARENNTDALKLLLFAKATLPPSEEKNYGFHDPLYAAAENGHLESFNLLLEAKADPHRQYVGASLLHAAAANGHANMTEALIRAKADIHQNMLGTPLVHAMENYYRTNLTSYKSTVDCLLKSGAKPQFVVDPFKTNDIESTLLIFAQLRRLKHNYPLGEYEKNLEHHFLAATEIRKTTSISFNICMLMSQYLSSDDAIVINKRISAIVHREIKKERDASDQKMFLFASGMIGILLSLNFPLKIGLVGGAASFLLFQGAKKAGEWAKQHEEDEECKRGIKRRRN